MIYIFDTGSLSKLKHFYPNVFKSVWKGLEALVEGGQLLSTREVWKEMQNGDPHKHTNDWLKIRQHIFTMPDAKEMHFVSQILRIPHFTALIGEKQRLQGTPVADPFVVAAARIRNGTVVTEERLKPGAAKIPNVCQHFDVPCIDLESFMGRQEWEF